jgi:hypothetical protein
MANHCPSSTPKFMSQRNNGKPKPRGYPTTGRDPVVAVRLPHEAIAEVDRLARTLGLASRSGVIRYVIRSIGPLEIKGGLGLPTEIRSIQSTSPAFARA